MRECVYQTLKQTEAQRLDVWVRGLIVSHPGQVDHGG